jgi:D-arginine dehydrogenase
MAKITSDVIVLGAGMAGASVAAFLAPQARVLLVEAEAQPGRHATGRSAATFFETYGNAPVRALVRASRDFLLSPPEGFTPVPLMKPQPALFIATQDQLCQLHAMRQDAAIAAVTREIGTDETLRHVPILRRERVAGGMLDHSGFGMDVDALLQGFLRRAKAAGAQWLPDIGFDAPVRYAQGVWRVHSRHGVLEAPVLVNATGAWADVVAQRAGVRAIGLQPLRRTALIVDSPEGMDTSAWPMVIDAEERFYFKPDAGRLLLSPANEDTSLPCDAAPDEIDIAIAVDRFETATTHPIRRILHRWAGLRSFVPDRIPVVGYAPDAPGFFWLAGQGGYGIETSPALGALAASLVLGGPVPDGMAVHGVDAAALRPGRLAAFREGRTAVADRRLLP